MSAPYKTTHLPPDEIDKLRLKAFATNEKTDVEAYYRAASLYFQERHERAMNRAACTPTDERVQVLEAENARLRDELIRYARWMMECPDVSEDVQAALRDT